MLSKTGEGYIRSGTHLPGLDRTGTYVGEALHILPATLVMHHPLPYPDQGTGCARPAAPRAGAPG
jgi:hypothetical protein